MRPRHRKRREGGVAFVTMEPWSWRATILPINNQKSNTMTQVRINITCDDGHVAEFLHELAAAYEDSLDNEMTYETGHGIAELSEEED